MEKLDRTKWNHRPAKPALRSRTIIGAITSIIVSLALLIGWTLEPQQVEPVVGAILNILCAGYTIWGRIRAGSKISGIFKARS